MNPRRVHSSFLGGLKVKKAGAINLVSDTSYSF